MSWDDGPHRGTTRAQLPGTQEYVHTEARTDTPCTRSHAERVTRALARTRSIAHSPTLAHAGGTQLIDHPPMLPTRAEITLHEPENRADLL